MSAHLDREKALQVLLRAGHDTWSAAGLLNALEACVVPDPPQTIDRDALVALFGDPAYGGTKVWDERERLASDVLGLVRPAAGITLTPEEAETARFAIEYTRHRAVLGGRDQAHMKALEAKLEASA